jgi:Domain of unknown function (DUF2703)
MKVSIPDKKRVAIDFLYLDLEVCERCKGTDANLEAALATVGTLLESAGADLRVTKTLVDSESKARALGFVSSPTIRVNGRDIALDFRESRCESEACACADGSGSPIDCRVWVYQDKEYTAAPVPMIVDAILTGVYGRATASAVPAAAHDVPENLLRLYRSSERTDDAPCCDAHRQESCCEPAQKSSCCGPRRDADAGACGCQ